MSQILDKYRNQAHVALVRLRDDALHDLQNGANLRRAVFGGQQYVPASTCEEIAMVAIEKSARVRALNDAIAVLKDVYKSLFEKEEHDGTA